ncbi:MAG: nucleoside hydrolase [Acidobacteria bacterium]|nr:nucleoside hydrolase [Acidobacteriota bacterium]
MPAPANFSPLARVLVAYRAAQVASGVLVLLLGLGCGAGRERIPVIFDHDGATDDYLALLMLVGSGRCDLRGVTVSYGLGHRNSALTATSMILHSLGLQVPVAAHAPALRGPNSFPDDWRDMSDQVIGLPILPHVDAPFDSGGSAALLIELLDDSETPVTLIVTEPLTNVADLIAQRPDLLAKIDRLVVMGGALDVPGNALAASSADGIALAEYNFYVDPVSADRVLEAAERGLDIVLAPLDVTNELQLTANWLQRLQRTESFGARLAAGILAGVEPTVAAGEYYLWDGAAVLALLSPESMHMKEVALSVEREGPGQGRLRRDPSRTATVKVATGVIEKNQVLDTALRWISDVHPEH